MENQQVFNPRIARLLELTKEYPNVYMPWSEEDDQMLLGAHRLFIDFNPERRGFRKSFIDSMAAHFGRHPNAIRSRIKKLLDLDCV
ncbi:MAG: hypothetical protein AAB345_04630 [Patescibacteria group bacterium]